MLLMEPVKVFARWWPHSWRKCVSGLRRLQKIELFEMPTFLGHGVKCFSDIIEGNWIQLLLYFLLFVNVAASFIGIISSICRSACVLQFFSFFSVTETFAIGFQSDLTTNGTTLQFSG